MTAWPLQPESQSGAPLEHSAELLRAIFDQALDAMLLVDDSRHCADCNPAACALLGRSREQLLGLHLPEVIATESAEQSQQRYEEFLQQGRMRGEAQVRRSDGTLVPVEFTAVANIMPGCHLSILRDVSERKAIEAAGSQAQERFRLLVQNSLDILTLVAADGTLLYESPSVTPRLGYQPDQLVGTDVFEYVHPDDIAEAKAKFLALIADPGGMASAVYRFRHADGDWRWLESSGHNRLHDPLLHAVVVNSRDISEHKQGEHALVEAKQEADRANRAKSDFLARMSHELRTPLNAILGFAQLLDLDPLPADQQDSVDHILRAGNHLLNLINEVLDVARIESGRLSLSIEPVPVHDVVQQTLSLVEPLAAKRGIRLRHIAGAEQSHWHALADRQRLQQVLLNLLSNAIKYNIENGHVELRSSVSPPDAGGQARVRIVVTDSGPGITAEQQERLFRPFERLGAEQTEVEGHGLGLALSRNLIELMGGAIGVDSAPGQGSTFWIDLPYCDSPAAHLPADVADALQDPAAAAEAATILYIEDNLSNLKLLERILAHRPYFKLLAVMQGSMGIEMAREQTPRLILLDLNLPDMHGREVLRRLKADPTTRGIPVVVVSADATPGQINRIQAAGAKRYLTKPLDVQQFFDVLDEVLKEPG